MMSLAVTTGADPGILKGGVQWNFFKKDRASNHAHSSVLVLTLEAKHASLGSKMSIIGA